MSKQAASLSISVDQQGVLTFIYDDECLLLAKLGKMYTRRASHVEPVSVSMLGETRTKWYADMQPVHGPLIGPFDRRSEALDAEIKWLKENVL